MGDQVAFLDPGAGGVQVEVMGADSVKRGSHLAVQVVPAWKGVCVGVRGCWQWGGVSAGGISHMS